MKKRLPTSSNERTREPVQENQGNMSFEEYHSDQFFHDYFIQSGRPFRSSENAAVGQRQFHHRCPDGTRFSLCGRTHQPPARQRQLDPASGPERTPLERASAPRHLCGVQAGRHCPKLVAASLRVLSFISNRAAINRRFIGAALR
jgi:hypothetical protein